MHPLSRHRLSLLFGGSAACLICLAPSGAWAVSAQKELQSSLFSQPDIIRTPGRPLAVHIRENVTNTTLSFSSSCFELTFTPAIVAADLTGDGFPELIRAMPGGDVGIFHNSSTGITGAPQILNISKEANDIAVADMDQDGELDIVTTNSTGTVGVLIGKGIGPNGLFDFKSMANYGSGNRPLALAIGDLDHDAKPDVVVCNFDDGEISVLRGTGRGGGLKSRVQYAVGSGPAGVTIGDLNGDGHPDVAVANFSTLGSWPQCPQWPDGPSPGSISLLFGNGDGTFQPALDRIVCTPFYCNLCCASFCFRDPTGLRDIHAVDLNHDSLLDLVLTSVPSLGGHGPSHLIVLMGQGSGAFGPATLYPVGSTGIDEDGDGLIDEDPDIFGFLRDDDNDGRVDEDNDDRARQVALADFDGNGHLDAATINQRTQSFTTYSGNGDGTFGTRCDFPAGGVNEVFIADMNQDGRPDLVDDNCIHYMNVNASLAKLADGRGAPGPESVEFSRTALVPNPMREIGRLRFMLSGSGPLSIKLYDVSGRAVRTLWKGEMQAGAHELSMDRTDDRGARLGPGLYFYRIEAGKQVTGGTVIVMD